MKHFFAAMVTGLMVTTAATAAPIGWINPKAGRATVGVEAGTVTSRDLEPTGGTSVELESIYYGLRGSYGLTDNFEVYARLGGADLDASSGLGDADGELAWGFGAQGIFYNAGAWNLAADATYFAHNDHSFGSNEGDFSEWHGAVQAQTQIEQFYPYVGVRYSDATLEINNQPDRDADDNVGVYVGSGFNISDSLSAYLEGRFIDETAFGGGLTYRF